LHLVVLVALSQDLVAPSVVLEKLDDEHIEVDLQVVAVKDLLQVVDAS